MEKYLDIFVNGYQGYANYLWNDIINPSWNSYFYWLILVSVVFFILEVVIPWRKGQSIIRKDFFMDAFYMFFNFFLFSLIIYNAASDVIVNLFNDGLSGLLGFNLQANNPLNSFPYWAVLLVGFFVRDFVQWWVHRLLHKSPTLWEFHKVHHSVEQMGFAAHLRYHWMENVIYRSLEYIPLALLGIGLYDFFVIHIFTLAWGHFNHSNITVKGWITGGILGILIGIVLSQGLLDITFLQSENIITQVGTIIAASAIGALALGPIMRKLFNSPEMHIWHHAYNLPKERQTGVNFGITLAIWDYIFGTAYIPHDGRDIRLGFPGIEEFPEDFVAQNTHGFSKNQN
ncbi:MAG: sterol desaturase/sphingolipid hydroxylase (fatty acid hydroxylase superfamily) [Saprospiraceae bacterium]|jgi:sterol desaturase/sphingolipid hydroxylase (fatty acid hydroxylase superfamily)